MKIAIASDDKMTVSQHFGKTRGFVIAEIDNKNVTALDYRTNTFTGHARGLEHAGHHIDRHSPILEALQDCEAVISQGMGRRIYDDLMNAGIKVFVTGEADVGKAIALYIEGKLEDRTLMGGAPCPDHAK